MIMNFAYKIFDHVLGNIEVRNHLIPQRVDRFYIAGCPPSICFASSPPANTCFLS